MSENAPLSPLDWCEYLATVSNGAMIRVVAGEAGRTSAQDNLPTTTSDADVNYFVLVWDGELPSRWRLIRFPTKPENFDDPATYASALQLPISKLQAVMLEPSPSFSLRIYIEGNVVMRLTPLPASRSHAESWCDALYASLNLQTYEEQLVKKAKSTGHSKRSALQAGLMNDVFGLQEKYYQTIAQGALPSTTPQPISEGGGNPRVSSMRLTNSNGPNKFRSEFLQDLESGVVDHGSFADYLSTANNEEFDYEKPSNCQIS